MLILFLSQVCKLPQGRSYETTLFFVPLQVEQNGRHAVQPFNGYFTNIKKDLLDPYLPFFDYQRAIELLTIILPSHPCLSFLSICKQVWKHGFRCNIHFFMSKHAPLCGCLHYSRMSLPCLYMREIESQVMFLMGGCIPFFVFIPSEAAAWKAKRTLI